MDNTSSIISKSFSTDSLTIKQTKPIDHFNEIDASSNLIQKTSVQGRNALASSPTSSTNPLSHVIHPPVQHSRLFAERVFVPQNPFSSLSTKVISAGSRIDLEKALLAYQLSDVKVIVENKGILTFKPAIDPITGKNNVDNMAHIARISVNEKGEKEILVHADSPWAGRTSIIDENGEECTIRIGLQEEDIAHISTLLNEYSRLTLLQSAIAKTKNVAPKTIPQSLSSQPKVNYSRQLPVVIKKPAQQLQKLLILLVLTAIAQDRKDQKDSKRKDQEAQEIIREAIKVDLHKAEVLSSELETRGLKA